MTRLYFDHAATTPLRAECAAIVAELAGEALNPSSVHRTGQRARKLLEDARAELAAAIGADPAEVVFVSGATEANNLALRGMADAFVPRGRPIEIASSALEHACVRETLVALERAGRARVRALPVAASGRATVITESPRPDALCLMAVQNETGCIQDLSSARKLCIEGAWWLCDASQALGKIPVNVAEIGASFVSLSSHKIGGPAGIGALAGPGVKHLVPQITGGPQEFEMRAGTQPVALAVAFARAALLAVTETDRETAWRIALEGALLGVLSSRGVAFRRNGETPRAPGFVNISVEDFDGADLVIALDARGIDVSSGAACSTGVMEVSPAIHAMFLGDNARAAGALRITFGRTTTAKDVAALAMAIADIVASAPGRRA